MKLKSCIIPLILSGSLTIGCQNQQVRQQRKRAISTLKSPCEMQNTYRPNESVKSINNDFKPLGKLVIKFSKSLPLSDEEKINYEYLAKKYKVETPLHQMSKWIESGNRQKCFCVAKLMIEAQLNQLNKLIQQFEKEYQNPNNRHLFAKFIQAKLKRDDAIRKKRALTRYYQFIKRNIKAYQR